MGIAKIRRHFQYAKSGCSYYVLINNNRDYLSPDFRMLAFNHVILAILPDPAVATST